jgi:hypothetical protein
MRTPHLRIITAALVATSFVGSALAAPPSSLLTGDKGTLKWTVAASGDAVTIDGSSPKWTVHHEAAADLTPKRTERSDADGNKVTVVYGPGAVVVTMAKKTVTHDRGDLWDADTLDVRLGDRIAREASVDLAFDALDPASGKIYGFTSKTVGQEPCGAATCTHLEVRLSGLLRMVGPKWEFWFAPTGQLMRFDGPIGGYFAAGVAP